MIHSCFWRAAAAGLALAAASAPLLAGPGRFTPLGLYGGVVSSLVTAPGQPGTVYIASPEQEKGPIWRSRDGGLTWTPVGDLITAHLVAVDPSAALTLYAFVDGALQRSTDGGASWSTLLPGEPVSTLVIAPSTPQTLYAEKPDGTLASSADGGATWERHALPRPPIGGEVGGSLAVGRATPTTVYFGGAGQIWRSRDGGASWQGLFAPGGGDPFVSGPQRLVVDPRHPSVLYASGLTLHDHGLPTPLTAPVIKSVDSGATW